MHSTITALNDDFEGGSGAVVVIRPGKDWRVATTARAIALPHRIRKCGLLARTACMAAVSAMLFLPCICDINFCFAVF
jgi:hypothetical protein